MNALQISFAKGGFILTVESDGNTSTEVFQSQAKLVKAVRTAIDELSLIPKKGDAEGDAE